MVKTIMALSFLSNIALAQSGPLCELNRNENLESIETVLEASSWPLLSNSDGQNNDLKSIGSFKINGSNCTTTLIYPPGNCEFNPDQQALVVTNGHCTKTYAGVKLDAELEGKVSFNYFKDTSEQNVESSIAKIEYSSMAGRDIALVRLSKTYAELAAEGITPKRIAQNKPTGPFKHPSIPVNFVQEPHTIRMSECNTSGPASIIENSWFWPDSIRLDCQARPGSSGSPLLNTDGEVAALVNTSVGAGGAPYQSCMTDRPCESNQEGTPENTVNGVTYGLDASFLHNCYANSCSFDATASGCNLPTSQIDARVSSPTNSPKLILGESGFTAIRYKAGPPNTLDCNDPEGFIESSPTAEGINLSSEREGTWVICVQGKDIEGNWQDSRDTKKIPYVVDTTPPSPVLKPGKGVNTLLPKVAGDEMIEYKYAYVNTAEECQQAHFSIPSGLQSWQGMSKNHEKNYLCFEVRDQAGNLAPIISYQLDKTEGQSESPGERPVFTNPLLFRK